MRTLNFSFFPLLLFFQESYERAKNILKTHQREHKMLAEALLKYETLDAEDIKAIMSGKETLDKSH
jgi:ATP-dependent metalloprotease